MGCNSSNHKSKKFSDPRKEERRKEILENIEDNENIVLENNRMLCMIERQITK